MRDGLVVNGLIHPAEKSQWKVLTPKRGRRTFNSPIDTRTHHTHGLAGVSDFTNPTLAYKIHNVSTGGIFASSRFSASIGNSP
jgi:hypothetical protein